ncbi:cation-transporting P-type ATPase [Agrobacterium rosae]|uniref:cation-transporting P-type ATPase n=1 Tax=Agrobacterium rosae TaxID=1972867 RepID=UPI00387AAE69
MSPRTKSFAPTSPSAYWSKPVADLMAGLSAVEAGLTAQEAQARLIKAGRNTLSTDARITPLAAPGSVRGIAAILNIVGAGQTSRAPPGCSVNHI